MDMKKGTCAMAGFAVSTLQRFNASTLQRFNASTLQRFSMYCVVLAMSGLYQAAKGYVRCLRWLARFSPATICLALAFVFSGTIGAVAQNADPVADTTGPTGLFEGLVAERTHDGMTPINFAVEFKEPVVGFTADDINRDSWFLPADLDPTLIDPTISEFEQDSTNSLRYTFTLTPRREEDMGFDFLVTIPAGSLTDAAGNPNARIGGQYFTYSAPSANTPPVADAGADATVNAEGTIPLDGNGSTVDSRRTLTYSWTQTGGTGGTLADEKTATPTFTAPTLTAGADDVIHTFTLTVTDSNSATSADTVEITVNAPPLAMVAGAAERTVKSGESVTLDGSGSSDSTGKLTYAWTRTGGTSISLTGETTDTLTFTADTLDPGAADVTHVFTLTVTDAGATDGVRLMGTTTVTITVTSAFADPVARAVVTGGQTTVASGAVVMLDGSSSTTDRRRTITTHAWTGGTPGATAALTNADMAMATFRAPTLTAGADDVTHTFTLTVTDSAGENATATVEITVTAPFPALVAEAGDPRTVDSGTPNVVLDGTGSTLTVGVRTVTYAWARTGGTGDSSVAPVDPTALQTSFMAETLTPGTAPVTHIFTLTVTDNQDSTEASDTVTFTVNAPTFPALVAEAGDPRTVDSGTRNVALDGTGSTLTVGVRTVTYAWARTGGTGDSSVVPVNPAALSTSFTAETLNPGATAVTHIFTLTVTDNQGSDAATDTVTFTVNAPGFTALVARAGDDMDVNSGQMGQLVGTGSTPTGNGRTVTYAWARTGGTGDSSVAPLAPAALSTSFTAETLNPGATAVTHIFTLTVTDNQGSDAATDTVTFTVNAPGFTALVARAGDDMDVNSGQMGQLVGTGSTPTGNGRTVTYAWARTGGTGDNSVVPVNPAALSTSFTAETLNPGATAVTHIFTLTVTDNQGSDAATDTVTFTVNAPGFTALVARAGDDMDVNSGQMGQLVGTGSTPTGNGRTVTYAWARTGGTGDNSVVPVNPAALSTSFTAETLNPGATAVTHIFTLTVTDNQGSDAATDTVTFTVNAPGFTALVARAGDDMDVNSGQMGQLVGTGSTPTGNGRTVTYAWARTGGTGDNSVVPVNPAALSTSFTAETLNPGATAVTHIFTLTVTDNQGSDAATDTVTFTVNAPGFTALVARAGDDMDVNSGQMGQLVGTGSTPTGNGRTVTYAWARTGGTGDSSVAPLAPAALSTSFTAETLNPGATAVTHIFTLTVTDNQGSDAATDTVTFTVNAPGFTALVARAGDDMDVNSGQMGQLVGTGSTPTGNGRTVTYAWARTGGTGDNSVVPVNPAALSTSFTAETLNPGATAVTHIFTLTVTDNQGSAAVTDTVTFTVNAPDFDALVAVAGTGGTVSHEAMVPLVGTGSTVSDSNRTITYAWARTGGTGDNSVAPDNPAALLTSFTAETLNPGATAVTHIFTLTVTDNQGSAAVTDTVTFTVNAPDFDALVAEAGTGGTVSHEAMVPLVGTGSTVSDSNRTITYAWARTGGTGDSSVAPVNPAALSTSFTAETLNPGATAVTHIFTLTVTDDQSSAAVTDTVTFTVNAPDFDALVAEAGTGGTVSHEAMVPLVGTGSTVSDSNRTITYAWSRTGGTGDSSVAPDNPAALLTSFMTETLNPGATAVTHIFTLTVTDNQGSAAVTDTVTFTVNAPDFDALVAEAGTGGTVSHEAMVPLVGTGSTVSDSNRTITYAWSRTGGTGDSSVAPDNPAALLTSFTAETLNPGATAVTHIFTLTVTDDQSSAAATDTVTFTVNAPDFDALVAEAGTGGTVSHEAVVPLVGTGSTVSDSNRTITYAWARTGGTGDSSVAPVNPAALSTSFMTETLNPGATAVTHIFTLTVTDNQGSAAVTDTVTFTVNAPDFDALVAVAGTGGTVSHEAMVPLVGTGSTVSDSNRTITYAWARTGGTGDNSVAPVNPAALSTSFMTETLNPGATAVTHIFTLTVTDNQGSAAVTDTVTFTVNAPDFDALVAVAGTGGTVSHEAMVPLVGTGSTVSDSNRTITYAWSRTGGTGDSSVAPDNPAALLTSFTAETLNPGATAVTHIFTLTVTDDQSSAAATDTVTFTVNPPGVTALVAEAGTGGTVSHEAVVPLVGTGSTVSDSNRTITYAWSRTGGTGDSSVAPDNPAALLTSFTAETLNPGATAVTHIFTLTVTDDQSSAAATDTVTFTVNAPDFDALVAEAGTGGTVSHEAVVPLVGTGSTVSDSNRTITYAWSRTGGTGDSSVAPVNPAALSTSFMTETLNPGATAVTHIFTLTVTDDQSSAAATDTVTFTVNAPGFTALVAEAGTGGTVSHEAVVPLVGTGSTVSDSNRTITYAWSRTGGTGDSSVAPVNPAALSTSFMTETLNPGATAVTHIFTLTVTDNQGSAAVTDTVTFTVNAPDFDALVAVAGTGGTVSHEAMVPLVGTGSTVSDSNRTITYAWARTGGTGDNSVAPVNPAALSTSFMTETLNPGATAVTHIFTLTVTDNQGSAAVTDTVTFTVNAPDFDALVAVAGTGGTVSHEAMVPLVGTGSTVSDSNRTITYAWARTGGTGDNSVAPVNPAALSTSFMTETLNPGATAVTHIFTLTVTDNQGSAAVTDTVTFTVNAPDFDALVAEAGTGGSVDSAAVVPLDGTGSTVSDSNRTVTYAWARTGGTGDSSVAPSNPAALQTSFTAETLNPGATAVTHIFTLTVSDNQGSAAVTDTVTITVTAPPVVSIESPNAGPDETIQAAPGETVTLVGSATEIDGTPFVSFLWERTGGTGDPTDVVLIGANTATLTLMFTAETAQASFVANTPEPGDADVTHIFTLTVTDSDGASHTSDPVTVIVSAVAQVERARAADPIPRPVGQFLETRATSLINNQPGLSSLLELDGSTPGGGGAFTFQATDGRLALDGGFLHNGVWGKVSGSRASSESGDTKSVTKSVLGSFGIHRKYSEHFLAGAMLQFDLSDHDRAGQVGTTHTIDGTGWLVGPYFAARHDTLPVYFEGRLLYGQSDNDIRFMDTASRGHQNRVFRHQAVAGANPGGR